MCDPNNRNILVWNVCAWNPFHSAVSRVLIVRLHSCIIRVCIGLVRTIAGANKSNGHPPSTSTLPTTSPPQLTCMQSVEFYGQLGKISNNPRNYEQRGSNEGLFMSLLYNLWRDHNMPCMMHKTMDGTHVVSGQWQCACAVAWWPHISMHHAPVSRPLIDSL